METWQEDKADVRFDYLEGVSRFDVAESIANG